MTLLQHHQAQEKHIANKLNVLRFLRSEKWTHQDQVQQLLGFKSRQAAHKILSKYEGEGLIKRHRIDIAYGRPLTVWGITVHGVMISFNADETMENCRAFEASKLAVSQMRHHLDLQTIQIKLKASGWKGWTNEGLKMKGINSPDALVIHPDGHKVAIEYERTLKALRRYSIIKCIMFPPVRTSKIKSNGLFFL